jgi:hypothetical protein
MWRLASCLFIACVAVLAAAADPTSPAITFEASAADQPRLPVTEPITGQPVEAAPDSALPKDPLAPYDVGDPDSEIAYEELSAEERAVVDRGRDTRRWRAIHDAYGAAVAHGSKQARAAAAQHQLGVDELERRGVVP